jgi:hypothetical protein
MNERIKLLADQADAYAEETIGPKWIGWEEIAPGWVECRDCKFAELVAKDCMAVCDTTSAEYLKHQRDSDDFQDKNIYAEGRSASDLNKHKIKKLFVIN